MEALDWIVIGVFALALIGIIVWVVKQKQNDSADYFFRRTRCNMACHRCIYICIEYRFGTLDRPRRCRSIQWYGYGSLGNSRMDDSYLRMGIRTVLFP